MEFSMAYLKDFLERIAQGDYLGFLRIWEEYCYSDEVDSEELKLILQNAKKSDIAPSFGHHVEKGLALWEKVTNKEDADEILALIMDIQTTNSPRLAEISWQYLSDRFENDPLFHEKMKIIGLKSNEFKGAITNFLLLNHLKTGNFVFHTAGWGTSEIVDVSYVREEVSLECDLVLGIKHLSFANVLKTLIRLPSDHFLARRFGNPDELEKEAKENPSQVIRLLLRDLGPKNAMEIKNELLDLVIPEKIWNKWWQQARAKMKKDTKIEQPSSPKGHFALRKKETPHEVAFYQELEEKTDVDETIQLVYSFLRDFPETLKNQEFKESLQEKLDKVLDSELEDYQKLQVLFFKEDLMQSKKTLPEIAELIKAHPDLEKLLQNIQVLSLKKRTLTLIHQERKDWQEIYLHLLFVVQQNLLRDHIFQGLIKVDKKTVSKKLQDLILHPTYYPEFYLWYFQKVITQSTEDLPLSDEAGRCELFEGFLILLADISNKPDFRELSKKMVSLITTNRYKIVRNIMQIASLTDVKEFLLLTTKCSVLTDHDIKIIHSLAEVAHPKLAKGKVEEKQEIIWTTEKGYNKAKSRLEEIANKELVETAREIEEARSHGDLRENAEYKAALEKRDRLQAEMKFLSDQLNQSQVITPEMVTVDKVSAGNVIKCADNEGKTTLFTLLGPWDADPEQNILSIQSRFAQAMEGKEKGETFEFQGENYTIVEILNYFEVK